VHIETGSHTDRTNAKRPEFDEISGEPVGYHGKAIAAQCGGPQGPTQAKPKLVTH
jgi:hypothetical protein